MTNWELLVAEMLAPAILLSESDLIARNRAAERYCAQMGYTPKQLAEKAVDLFPVPPIISPDDASWQNAQLDGHVDLPLRARWLQLEPGILLVLADSPENSLGREDLLSCLDQLPVEFHIRDANTGRFLYANRAELLLSGKRNGSCVVGQTPEQVYGVEAAEKIDRTDKKLFKQPSRTRVFVGKHGDIDYRASKQLVWSSTQGSPLIVRIAEDITEFSKAREERKQLMRDLCRAESIARVGSYRLDLRTERLHASVFLYEMLELQCNLKSLEFADILSLFSKDDVSDLLRAHKELMHGADASSADLTFTSNNTSLELELRCELLRDEEGNPVAIYGALLDVSKRVKAEQQVRHMAYHDMLTGMPNRAHFMKESLSFMRMAHRGQESFALHLVDLDGFKEINDRLGHLAGDRVLQVVSSRIRAAIKDSDVAARIGGDEFAILHSGVSTSADIEKLGSRLVTSISEPIVIDSNRVCIGASLGVAIFEGEDSVEQMVHRADQMLYEVKRSGKGAFKLAS